MILGSGSYSALMSALECMFSDFLAKLSSVISLHLERKSIDALRIRYIC